jgi:hypothetical protein
MAFITGNGGTCKIKVGAGTIFSLPISKWKLSKKRVLANVTNSLSGGIKQRKGTVLDQMVTIECPLDDTINPDDNDFEEGAEVEMHLRHGEDDKEFYSEKVIIETCDYENDEDEDVMRLVIVGYANKAFVKQANV